MLLKKIILSLCYEDCEPTYKSSLKTLDLIVFSAPHRRPELHQRTGRLQGPSSGLSSLNYWTSRFYVIPLRPVHTAQRANSLAVTIFAEALTASPNALRRSSNERLRWFTIFDARRVRVAYFGQNSGPKYCTKWFLNWLFWFLRRLSSKVCRYYGSLYNIRYKTNRFGATALGIS